MDEPQVYIYKQGQRYAPVEAFRDKIADLGITARVFYDAAGVPDSTYTAMLKRGSCSRTTARKLAAIYATRRELTTDEALAELFQPLPRVEIAYDRITHTFARHAASA
jgi:hypothetical protein